MVPLISNPVTDTDARLQIAAKLDELGIKYQLRPDNVFYVADEKTARRVRMILNAGEPHSQGDRPVGPVRHGALDHNRLRAGRQPPARHHETARAAHPGAGRRGQRQRHARGAQDRAVRGGPEAHHGLHHHHPQARLRHHDQPQEDRWASSGSSSLPWRG